MYVKADRTEEVLVIGALDPTARMRWEGASWRRVGMTCAV